MTELKTQTSIVIRGLTKWKKRCSNSGITGGPKSIHEKLMIIIIVLAYIIGESIK